MESAELTAPSGAEPEGNESIDSGPSPEDFAREKGWKPKEEFGGNKQEWIDAEEFLKREPLFDKIKNQSKDLKKLQKTIESMATHFHKNVEAQVKTRIAELRAEKREAIELGDVQRVETIEQQIHDAAVSMPTKDNTPSIAPEVDQFVATHKWFTDDMEMREFAIAHNDTYLKRNPGAVAESLDKTLDAVKRAFPEKFKPQIKAPSVESGSHSQNGGKYNASRLSPEQKMAYKQYVTEHKIMTHDDYFKSLEDIGELK